MVPFCPAVDIQPLEPRRDVDAVAQNVVSVDDDVAKVDANAVANAPILGNLILMLGYGPLHLDRALHGSNDTSKLHEQSIARGLDDAPFVPGNAGVDQLFAETLVARDRPFLVSLHEARVAHHVGGEDGGKSAFDALLCHGDISIRDTRNNSLYG